MVSGHANGITRAIRTDVLSGPAAGDVAGGAWVGSEVAPAVPPGAAADGPGAPGRRTNTNSAAAPTSATTGDHDDGPRMWMVAVAHRTTIPITGPTAHRARTAFETLSVAESV